tara:strand:+ start:64 stop:756 length:693 start_codon:yes stop_codon:yes gene_type:complete
MAALSDYLESGIMSHLFFGETFTPPTSLALALTSGVPRDNDDGSTMFELPSGQSKGLNFVSTNYSRVNLGSAATGSGTWNQVGVDDVTAFQVNSDIVNHSGYFYPLYLDDSKALSESTDGSPGITTLSFESIYPGVTFYSPNGVSVSGSYVETDPGYTEYNGNGFIKNKNQIVFGTAVTEWGWVSGVVILDTTNHASGNVLLSATLENPRYIYIGDTIKFDSNSLEISLK